MPLSPERNRVYQRERCARRRAAWLAANGPCVKCGSGDRLQVDHIDPAEKVSHRVWSWSEARLAAELAKCQVLCLACHQAKSGAEVRAARAAVPFEHGFARTYNRGCRCDECRAAKREYDRGRRR